MSGGHFDYNQYKLHQIADEIDDLIYKNDVENEYGYKYNYNEETLNKFRYVSSQLKELSAMVQRIDWLASGDDGEDDFHKRWKEEGLKGV